MVARFYKKILKSLFFFAFSPLLSAQNPDLEAANVHFQSALFKEAIPEYERVLLKDPNHALSKARLAACYRFTNNLSKAAFYYAQIANHPEYRKQLLEYGQTLKSLQQYDEAQKIFTQYAQAVDASVGNALAKSCEWAKNQNAAQNAIFSVQNLDSLNTKNADFAPAFFKDQLVFSSARSVAVDKKGTITWTNDAFNQYYLAIADASGQKFAQAKPLRNFIGKDINDAPLAFSKDGNYVAITSNNFMDGIRQIDGSGLMMDIYSYEVLSVREWKQSSEQFFPYNASVDSETPFSTGHPFLTEKGDAMYFCSNRPGGFGGYDIYVAYRTQRGWTIPKNMGAPINTAGNEMSPFLDATGRLFFASDFHPGYGGLDVFTAERFNTAWVNVQNLGAGINSPFDDFYFIYDNQRRQAYFTSNRAGGKGNEDIYKGTQLKNFSPRAKQSIDLGEQLVFRYIQFNERNELVFSNGEGEMMQELLMALLDNPELVIQVYAFTDARGTPANNLESSTKRARLLSEYLTANGVPAKRIQHAGFGENYLLNNCRDKVRCTESEHFVNRRIEITIAGKMDETGAISLSYDATPNPKMLSRTVPAENRTKPREVTITMSELPTVTAPSIAEKGVPDPRNVEKTKRGTSSSRKSRDEREKIREQDKNKKNVEPEAVATNPKNKKLRRKESYSVGDEIETADIFHEKNKTSVDEKNSPGLKEILELMIDQPYLVLEVGSHTDSKGDDKLNQDLSQKRAEAIRSYLVKKGIPNDRLVAKGYGESKILNKCKEGVKCSDDEHEANRRTEFKVIGQKGFKINDVIQVAAIEYERNDAKIDMKRSKGLQEILDVLKGSSISVEIRSHTDANGTSKYNLELSEKRAKSIYDYLVKNGISKFRLKYKGYGETMLTNHCKEGVKCSDEEHAQNRRTDFKILGLK